MKKLILACSKPITTLFTSALVLGILMFIAYTFGKSLESFVPVWIVWLVLIAANIRNKHLKPQLTRGEN